MRRTSTLALGLLTAAVASAGVSGTLRGGITDLIDLLLSDSGGGTATSDRGTPPNTAGESTGDANGPLDFTSPHCWRTSYATCSCESVVQGTQGTHLCYGSFHDCEARVQQLTDCPTVTDGPADTANIDTNGVTTDTTDSAGGNSGIDDNPINMGNMLKEISHQVQDQVGNNSTSPESNGAPDNGSTTDSGMIPGPGGAGFPGGVSQPSGGLEDSSTDDETTTIGTNGNVPWFSDGNSPVANPWGGTGLLGGGGLPIGGGLQPISNHPIGGGGIQGVPLGGGAAGNTTLPGGSAPQGSAGGVSAGGDVGATDDAEQAGSTDTAGTSTTGDGAAPGATTDGSEGSQGTDQTGGGDAATSGATDTDSVLQAGSQKPSVGASKPWITVQHDSVTSDGDGEHGAAKDSQTGEGGTSVDAQAEDEGDQSADIQGTSGTNDQEDGDMAQGSTKSLIKDSDDDGFGGGGLLESLFGSDTKKSGDASGKGFLSGIFKSIGSLFGF